LSKKVWVPFELVTPANINDYLQKNQGRSGGSGIARCRFAPTVAVFDLLEARHGEELLAGVSV